MRGTIVPGNQRRNQVDGICYELKAMVATYLSEWGGDARADAVGADIGAMFDAREL